MHYEWEKKDLKIRKEHNDTMKMTSTRQFSNTNIEEVKKLNAQSGLSYTEVKKRLAEEYFLKQNQNIWVHRRPIASYLHFKHGSDTFK